MKKFILNQVLLAIVVLLSIFVLGLVVPMIISIFVVLNTDITWNNAITCPLFWIFAILGWLVSSVYLNDMFKKAEDND